MMHPATSVRALIQQRIEYMAGTSDEYPHPLRSLEIDLVARNIGMSGADAAAVLLCWVLQSLDADDAEFFLTQRDAARLISEITSEKLRDDNHARMLGRRILSKLTDLGIISVVKAGTQYTATRRSALATRYRWVWRGASEAASDT